MGNPSGDFHSAAICSCTDGSISLISDGWKPAGSNANNISNQSSIFMLRDTNDLRLLCLANDRETFFHFAESSSATRLEVAPSPPERRKKNEKWADIVSSSSSLAHSQRTSAGASDFRAPLSFSLSSVSLSRRFGPSAGNAERKLEFDLMKSAFRQCRRSALESNAFISAQLLSSTVK